MSPSQQLPVDGAINLRKAMSSFLIQESWPCPLRCPLYPWPKTRPEPIRPILGSSKESVSPPPAQPVQNANAIPVAEAPPLQAIRQSCPCAHCQCLFPSRDHFFPTRHYAQKRDHVGRAVICRVVSSYFVASRHRGGKRSTSREPSTACPHPPHS